VPGRRGAGRGPGRSASAFASNTYCAPRYLNTDLSPVQSPEESAMPDDVRDLEPVVELGGRPIHTTCQHEDVECVVG